MTLGFKALLILNIVLDQGNLPDFTPVTAENLNNNQMNKFHFNTLTLNFKALLNVTVI